MIADNDELSEICSNHNKNLIQFLLNNDIEFFIIVDEEFTNFDPKLPDDIKQILHEDYLVFGIVGYSFETAQIVKDHFSFEAAFGEMDFLSKITVPFCAINKIYVEKEQISINPTIPKIIDNKNVFLQNPNNLKILKKK